MTIILFLEWLADESDKHQEEKKEAVKKIHLNRLLLMIMLWSMIINSVLMEKKKIRKFLCLSIFSSLLYLHLLSFSIRCGLRWDTVGRCTFHLLESVLGLSIQQWGWDGRYMWMRCFKQEFNNLMDDFSSISHSHERSVKESRNCARDFLL